VTGAARNDLVPVTSLAMSHRRAWSPPHEAAPVGIGVDCSMSGSSRSDAVAVDHRGQGRDGVAPLLRGMSNGCRSRSARFGVAGSVPQRKVRFAA
jgi:hypothetical protein